MGGFPTILDSDASKPAEPPSKGKKGCSRPVSKRFSCVPAETDSIFILPVQFAANLLEP